MNENDLNNIEFVLSMHPNAVTSWLNTLTNESEFFYALSIIECARWQLLDEYVQTLEECKLANKVLSEIFYAK